MFIDIHDIERLHIAIHPFKMRLLRHLLKSNSDVVTLQKELQVKRKVIAYHLNELETLGLVEYEIPVGQGEKRFETKCYRVTEKGNLIYESIVHLLNILKVPRKKARRKLLKKI